MTEPISIIGIDTDEVGHPRNDGTPGSGLYAVPIKLSRVVSEREAALLVHFWNNPTSWSTMHRSGIARVSGATLVLDGTTIDEVQDVHAATVRFAVSATNEAYAKEIEAKRLEQESEEARKAAHQDEVRRVAGEIGFD